MSAPVNYNQQIIEDFRANKGKTSFPLPLILLTTTGARSGQPRIAPVAYSTDGDRLVIAASKGGAPTNPDWYYNLVANPIVTVERGAETYQARATVVTDDAERQRLYAHHAEVMPGFAEYSKKTDRKIPIVLLERIA